MFNEFMDTLKNKYTQFNGRASRREYWIFVLFIFLTQLVLGIILNVVHLSVLGGILSLAFLIPGLAVGIRRLHDIGKSGWWLLIGLIPVIGAIILIIFYCMPGTAGQNKYGSDPRK
jgi:uncharacterized membrane protein YhaH (DUF805 family)